MIANLMDILFGCWHSNYSFPITTKDARRHPAAQVTGTYVVCLECGKEFAYSWKEMRVVSAPKPKAMPAPVLVEARESLPQKQAA